GETIHAELDLPIGTARRWARDPRRPARARLRAHQVLGAELERLDAAGWRVLHAVPLPGADRIDHLLIGPGGVFAVHTVPAHRLRLQIADPEIRAGRGVPVPLLRLTRRRAERACSALATAVRPVLAVVGAARLEVLRAPGDVRVLRERDVASFADLGAVHKPADIAALHALARDRRTWLRS
ncbi:nuclease-related domain-containing protein, partial [Streptomyces sp. NPDC059129]